MFFLWKTFLRIHFILSLGSCFSLVSPFTVLKSVKLSIRETEKRWMLEEKINEWQFFRIHKVKLPWKLCKNIPWGLRKSDVKRSFLLYCMIFLELIFISYWMWQTKYSLHEKIQWFQILNYFWLKTWALGSGRNKPVSSFSATFQLCNLGQV